MQYAASGYKQGDCKYRGYGFENHITYRWGLGHQRNRRTGRLLTTGGRGVGRVILLDVALSQLAPERSVSTDVFMSTKSALYDLEQSFRVLDARLPGFLYCEAVLENDYLHLDDKCPSLAGGRAGLRYETRSLGHINATLECSACSYDLVSELAVDKVRELLAEPLAVLALCKLDQLVPTQPKPLGSLINSLRPSVWVDPFAVDVLLGALEARFPPDLPKIGTAWLVHRGAGTPTTLLPDGLHHPTGVSLLLLPANLSLIGGPDSPGGACRPSRLKENVNADDLQRIRHLFFQMVVGGVDPALAIQAALAI